jgi:hypothetical protein
MGNPQSAQQFYKICLVSSLYFNIMICYFSAILSLIAIELMRRIQGWHNLSLFFLLLCILSFSVSNIIYDAAFLSGNDQNFIFIIVYLAGNDFCHWIITITYIQVSFETRMLLNKDTYLKSAHELVLVEKYRCFFKIMNAVISLLILLIAITLFLSANLHS